MRHKQTNIHFLYTQPQYLCEIKITSAFRFFPSENHLKPQMLQSLLETWCVDLHSHLWAQKPILNVF